MTDERVIDVLARGANRGQPRGADCLWEDIVSDAVPLSAARPGVALVGRHRWVTVAAAVVAFGAVALALGAVDRESPGDVRAAADRSEGDVATVDTPPGYAVSRRSSEVHTPREAGHIAVYDELTADGRRVRKAAALSVIGTSVGTSIEVFTFEPDRTLDVNGNAILMDDGGEDTNGLTLYDWTTGDGAHVRLASRGLSSDEVARAISAVRVNSGEARLEDPDSLGLTEVLADPDTSPYHLASGMISETVLERGSGEIRLVGQSGLRPTARQLLWYFADAELIVRPDMELVSVRERGTAFLYRRVGSAGSVQVIYHDVPLADAMAVAANARFEHAAESDGTDAGPVGERETTTTTKN